MKKTFLLFLMLAFFALPLSAQYAARIRPMPALPASCNPLNGDVLMLTVGAGVSPGIYNCTALNTWRPIGMIGNQFVINQGTITANTPFISHTATWNNAATVFQNFLSNVTVTAANAASRLWLLQNTGNDRFAIGMDGRIRVTQGTLAAGSPGYFNSVEWNNGAVTFEAFRMEITDTASTAVSTLMELQVGGGSIFSIRKDGVATVAAAGGFRFDTRSRLYSSADGRLGLANFVAGDFDRLSLGTESAADPAIKAVAAVGGQSQGIKITDGAGAANTFADLGAAENGAMTYCADCTIATPCAGAGTGAIAKRLNGVWVCN
jgi:hypothetical protein